MILFPFYKHENCPGDHSFSTYANFSKKLTKWIIPKVFVVTFILILWIYVIKYLMLTLTLLMIYFISVSFNVFYNKIIPIFYLNTIISFYWPLKSFLFGKYIIFKLLLDTYPLLALLRLLAVSHFRKRALF